MENNNKKALKAGIWYTISNFFIKGITFISIPIFTRIMSTEDIGNFSNISAWFNILAILTSFELYSSIVIARFDYKDDIDSYISSILFLGTLITLTFFGIVIIFRDFFVSVLNIKDSYLNIIFVYLLVYPAIQIYQKTSQIKYKYKSSVLVSLAVSVGTTLISLIYTLTLDNKLDGRVYGYYIPSIIIAIIIYIYIMIKGKSMSPKYWRYALIISFPLIWHLLASDLLQSSDRIMIINLIDASSAGLYSVSSTCSSVVSVLWTSMNTAWSPWAFEKMNNKEYSDLRKYSKPYFMFFFFIAIAFMLFAPELLMIMGGKTYLESIYVIPPIMCGYIFQFIYSLYVNIEYYHKKQKYIACGTIIAALVNIILNYLFIPIFGYIAAAYTTLFGYLLLYLIHYFIVKKMGYAGWYDKSFFKKASIMSIFITLLVNILYKFNIIRYLIIIIFLTCICAVILKNRKEIILAIKNKSISDLVDILKKCLK